VDIVRGPIAPLGLYSRKSKTVAVLCEAGDWISVPAGLAHQYDGGKLAAFDALRMFTRPDGWVADFTGAGEPTLPLLDDFSSGVAASAAASRSVQRAALLP
jgi:1,2-dihydroxy-3-keto-5-methylthiopentene dioxygenase